MLSRFILVTGMQRSGTTLLDKLLSSHPEILLLSQPTPLIFIEAKRRFLLQRGLSPEPYPLSDLFLEDRYNGEKLARFLNGEPIPRQRLRQVFEEMQDYSGQYTRLSSERLAELPHSLCSATSFAEIMKCLYTFLAEESNTPVIGAKETLCEEYLPYLLHHGFRGLIIVRDPRDVLASLNFGKGVEFAGTLKPTLFNLRNWRKSVAFALHLLDHPRFGLVRYEDLVREPVVQLQGLTDILGTSRRFEVEFLQAGVRNQDGSMWRGNSSHGARKGISTASVGKYERCLPKEVIRYTEAVCLPELRCLGYAASVEFDEAPEIIRSYRDPFKLTRRELRGYLDPARATEEVTRLELLTEAPSDQSQPYFLFSSTHRRLARSMSEP